MSFSWGKPTVLFKSCPRCKGDVSENRDQYGRYRQCVQCGWLQDAGRNNRFDSVRDVERRRLERQTTRRGRPPGRNLRIG